MTAKEYLGQAYRLDQRINSKLEQLTTLRALASRVTGTAEGEVVSHTRNVHANEEAMIRFIEAEKELNREIDKLVNLRMEISALIRKIRNPEYQLLLEYRYILFKGWAEIAELLDLEERYIYKVHGRALLEVEKYLNAGQ